MNMETENKEGNIVIELNNVQFKYNSMIILDDINLTVREKDFLSIIGPNGSGKSTLLRIIMGLLSPQKGTVKILGGSPEKNRERIGYLPQGNFFDINFPLTIEDIVLQGLINKHSFLPFFRQSDKAKAARVMEELGIYDIRTKQIGHLSGGQKQKTFIARALVANPTILVLDEPNAHIDSEAEQELYEILKEINNEITIIMVSHDVSAVSTLSSKVACVNKNISVNAIEDLIKQEHPANHLISGKYISIKHTCKL